MKILHNLNCNRFHNVNGGLHRSYATPYPHILVPQHLTPPLRNFTTWLTVNNSQEWASYRAINDRALRYNNYATYETCKTSIFRGSAIEITNDNLRRIRSTRGGYVPYKTSSNLDDLKSYTHNRIHWINDHITDETPETLEVRPSGPLYISFWVLLTLTIPSITYLFISRYPIFTRK